MLLLGIDDEHVVAAYNQINPDKLGAQMNATLAGDVDLALKWADMCRLVVATVAPEIL